MGKIFCIMGKSASGKDTIYKVLLEKKELNLRPMVSYTTRPIREGEQAGVEYFFSNEDELKNFTKDNKLIEVREYHTVHGVWKYFTVDDGRTQIEDKDYILIGTLESFLKLRQYYGKEVVVPIYIQVDDGLRLSRALARERQQEQPRYAELCRRYLADDEDFSSKKLMEAGVDHIFENHDFKENIGEVLDYIEKCQGE
jgi:guanylate kinase